MAIPLATISLAAGRSINMIDELAVKVVPSVRKPSKNFEWVRKKCLFTLKTHESSRQTGEDILPCCLTPTISAVNVRSY